jgi:hypothetical protein
VSGGNAKYAIVAVLLVLGIVAVVGLRSCPNRSNGPAPAPSAAVAQSAEPPSNPKLEDIPPPPVIEEKPEAGPTGPRIVYVPAGGCESTCSQRYATSELTQALQVRGLQARRCYNQALSRDSSLKGHVTINVRVGPSGNVCSASVASNDMGTPGVAECAANIFRSNTYPSPRGGCVDSSIPLSFVPQGQ